MLLYFQVFLANIDNSTVVSNTFSSFTLRGRYFRIVPINWNIRPCLRLELFGCRTSKYRSTYYTALLSSRLLDCKGVFFCNISHTRKSVSSDFRTPRSGLKKRGAAEFFVTNFEVFVNRMKHSLKRLNSFSNRSLPKKWASGLVYVRTITIKNTTLCKHHKVYPFIMDTNMAATPLLFESLGIGCIRSKY